MTRPSARLTDELVTALLRAERAPDTAFMRENTMGATWTRWSLRRNWSAVANLASPDFGPI